MKNDTRKPLGIADVHRIVHKGGWNTRNSKSWLMGLERFLSGWREMQIVFRLPVGRHCLRAICLDSVPRPFSGFPYPGNVMGWSGGPLLILDVEIINRSRLLNRVSARKCRRQRH